MAQLKQPIEAPQPRPARYGLVVAAPIIEDSEFRFGPFTFLPERCGQGGRLAIECEGDTASMAIGASPDVVNGSGFMVFGGEKCSTLGMNAVDLRARAERMLTIVQSFEIADELWSGGLNLDAKSLADVDADTLTEGAGAAVDVLGCIDQGIGQKTKGQQGMVHMTPQVLDHLVTNGTLYRDAGLWLTPMGNIVVADYGYDGTGPNGEPATDSQWIYGTTMITLRLGAIESIPDLDMQAVTRSINDIEVWAYRAVAWVWDECGHVAGEVNIAPCAFAGTS